MKYIQIKNSYKVWRRKTMNRLVNQAWYELFGDAARTSPWGVEFYLGRSYRSMYIEWWLHNIGYYISLPLKKWEFWRKINERCKDVDLEEWP